MSPPATFTGVLAFTAFWCAWDWAAAACSVAAPCAFDWNCPAPPQPLWQDDDAYCDWSLFWLVDAELPALADDPFSAAWLAELCPPEMLPPAMLTGELAFTAFCFACDLAAASCAVRAPCALAWYCPEP